MPIIIFLVIFSPTLVSYHLNIFHSSKFPTVCCKSQNVTFLPSIFLVPTFLSYPSRNFVWRHILPKKREHSNAGFAGIPARYPILPMSVSARLRGRKISQIIPNLWMTRAYLYSLSFPNGIEFLNTFLLFVSNHGNCQNYMFMCSYIPQRASWIVYI